MPTSTYQARRGELETYFDRTAAETWARLTSDAPVSGVRATVRAGRDRMRAILLGWLPADLHGARILDAGCGTGALSIEAAKRGADVVAIDVAGNLVNVARERTPADLGRGRIDFRVGDMFDPQLGRFDHIVAMDSLIHYKSGDIARVLGGFAARCDGSIVFTIAPRTPMLTVMLTAGALFPRGDRAPAIAPVSPAALTRKMKAIPGLQGWRLARDERVSSGFYTSQALETVRS